MSAPDSRQRSTYSPDDRDHCDGDVSGSGSAEGSGHFTGGGACGENVVDDQDAFAGDTSERADSEGTMQILQATGTTQARLVNRVSDFADKAVSQRDTQVFRQPVGDSQS